MGDRSTLRLGVDLAFVAAVITCGVVAHALSRPGPLPTGVCSTQADTPRYDRLYADGTLSIGIVIGELEGGAVDHNRWTARVLERELTKRGVAFDLVIVRDNKTAIAAALEHALATHELVYYNGHSHSGHIRFSTPSAYRLVFFDTCWSTQLYSKRLVGAEHDVLTNTNRSITGSVDSFFILLDGLRARATWTSMLDDMNDRAKQRAHLRAPLSRFKDPEHYRVDVACAK